MQEEARAAAAEAARRKQEEARAAADAQKRKQVSGHNCQLQATCSVAQSKMLLIMLSVHRALNIVAKQCLGCCCVEFERPAESAFF